MLSPTIEKNHSEPVNRKNSSVLNEPQDPLLWEKNKPSKIENNKHSSFSDAKKNSHCSTNLSKLQDPLITKNKTSKIDCDAYSSFPDANSSNAQASSFSMENKTSQADNKTYSCFDEPNNFNRSKSQNPVLSMKQYNSEAVEDKNSPFSDIMNNSDFNLKGSRTEDPTLLNSIQNSDDESNYSSALSSLDEDREEEDSLTKPSHTVYKSKEKNIILPPKITENVTHGRQISNDQSGISKKLEQEQIILSHEDRLLRTKFIEHLVLAHSQIQLYTVEKLEDVFLAQSVINEMKRMFIDKVFRIQSFAWPHMIGGNGLFIVNAAKSGKTWSYLPPLCSSIIFAIQNLIVPSTYGPMAIVLVPTVECAIEVGNTCTRFLSGLVQGEAKTVVFCGIKDLRETKIQLMEACAILITTPSNMLRLMEENEHKDPLFDPKRIQHIVIDNIDLMLSRAEEDFTTGFKKLHALVTKIGKGKKISPQLVVTSCTYQPVFKKLIPISNQALLLIGDFLEAAVYGKANIVIKLSLKEEKLTFILNFIKEHSISHEPLIILCNSEGDVLYVVENLLSRGISSIGFHNRSSNSARQQVEDWKVQFNPMSVLVCSDDVFPELEIQNAQNLIHYSLAKSWTKFTLRFISLIKIYEKLVVKGFDGPPPQKRATSLVLLDEDNNTELPRLIEFFKTHNQIERIQPDVLELSKHIQKQREMKRCPENTQMCSSLFEFGDCNNTRCEYRHVLAIADIKQESTESLRNGDIRLRVLNVFSPTHFSAQLLEHRPIKSTKWRLVRQSDKAKTFANKFYAFYFLNPDNLIMHWPVKVNDLCICKKNDLFYRARVLDASKIKSTNIVQSVQIKLKLIDTGDVLHTKSDEIYVCHDRFRDFPAQAVDIRLMGVLPFDNECVWDAKATQYVKVLIRDGLAENECVHATVDFALNDTIWVNNVVIMEHLPTLRNSTYKCILKQHLVNKKYGVMDKNIVTKIHNIIEEQGFGYILEKAEAISSANTTIQSENSVEQSEEKSQQPLEIQENQIINQALEAKLETSNCKLKVNNCNMPISDKNDSAYDADFSKLSSDIESTTIESVKSKTQVCTFEEFIKHCEREIDAEAEENEWLCWYLSKFVREAKKECNTIINEKKKDERKKQNGNDFVKPNKTIDTNPKTSTEALKTKSILQIQESQKNQQATVLPKPINLHQRPKTVWHETNYLIILSIYAPNINDYFLEVTKSTLDFAADVNGVQQVLHLDFLGTVEPNLVSDEIRGPNVVVHLVKTLFMNWPRLVKQTEKMPWLTYNLDMINSEEEEELLPKLTHTPSNFSDEDFNEFEDNEIQYYKNFTPIVNNDFHDPINELG